MKPDRIWDISVVKTKGVRKRPNLLFTWTDQAEHKILEHSLDMAFNSYCRGINEDNEDKYIGLRGELGSEEFYPLVRLFNVKIINEGAKEITEELIKFVYPKSNVYWYLEKDSDLRSRPSSMNGYCERVHLLKGFCPSFLASSAIRLLEYMYSNQTDYLSGDSGIWVLEEDSNNLF